MNVKSSLKIQLSPLSSDQPDAVAVKSVNKTWSLKVFKKKKKSN